MENLKTFLSFVQSLSFSVKKVVPCMGTVHRLTSQLPGGEMSFVVECGRESLEDDSRSGGHLTLLICL